METRLIMSYSYLFQAGVIMVFEFRNKIELDAFGSIKRFTIAKQLFLEIRVSWLNAAIRFQTQPKPEK